MKHSIQPKNSGIGLLELMLAIIIITSIALASTRYFIVVRENARIAQTMEMVNNIADASFKWLSFVNQRDFTGLSLTTLVDLKLLPSSYTANPWRGITELSAATFIIHEIPSKACTNMVQKLSQSQYSSFIANPNCSNEGAQSPYQKLTITLVPPA